MLKTAVFYVDLISPQYDRFVELLFIVEITVAESSCDFWSTYVDI